VAAEMVRCNIGLRVVKPLDMHRLLPRNMRWRRATAGRAPNMI
jgi:hypothetical protein